MRNNYLIIFYLFISALPVYSQTLASRGTPSEATPLLTFGSSDYYPLSDKQRFIYDSNLGETEAEINLVDSAFVLDYESSGISYKQTLLKRTDGIYLIKTENKALFFGKSITYEKPVLLLPFPFAVGQTWTWQGNQFIGDDTVAIILTGKIIGQETLQTKAGKFNCAVVNTVLSEKDGKSNSVTEWFAPSVGIVKAHAQMQGSGIGWLIQKLMGLNEVTFQLAEIKK